MFESSEDRQDENAERKSFELGMLLGALLGASAALLLAPDSGVKTRKKIKKRARRVYLQGNDVVGDLWDNADKSTRQLRKQARRKLNRGWKQGSRYVDDAADLVETGRRRLGWR